MAIPLDVNGVVFSYPVTLDEDWGDQATAWAQAVTDGMLQMQGGSFPLTADVNFGANFGLLSKYFSTRSANASTVGTIRLSSADLGIGWRNNANSGNLILTTDASDQLLYNGFPIATSGGGAVTSITGTANQIIASSPTGAVTLSTPQDIATTSSPTFAALTLSAPLPVASGGTGVTTSTGTGSVVLSTSPTLTTPTLNSPVLVTPALGTPSSGTLTNCTGLPIDAGTTGTLPISRGGTGQTSFASGALSSNGSALTSGTLSVANGGTGTTTSTGTGSVVLSNSPTLVTPALGTPSAAVLTNATGLPLTTGVTGILPNANTTATAAATASTIVLRDASVNARINEIVENFSTTVTAAGTTTLTVTSSPLQQFTGTTTQIVKLPDATTLTVGHYFTILNRSTGAITVNNNGNALVFTVAATAQTTFVVTNVGTSNGTWDVSTSSGGTVTAFREDYVVGTALNNYTGSLTVFNLVNPYSVGGNNLIVTLDGDIQTKGASVDYLETNSTTVTFNNSLVVGQKVSFIYQTTTSSGGTVNSGTAGQIAYYPATGPTVSGTNDPTGIVSIGSTFIGVGRNRFINGDMTVDQKNGGNSATANNASLAYVPSMFLLLSNFGGALEGVMSIQQLTASPPTGFTHYARITVTTADASISAANNYEYLSAIEGNNVKDLLFGTASAKPVSLSFWVRSSITGTFGGGIVNEAQDRSYVFQYTINVANTWEYKTISLAGDTGGTWVTGTGRGVQLFWDMGSGSNAEGTVNAWNSGSPARWRASGNTRLISTGAATWDLTGVQFEIGSTATAFEYLTAQANIFNCERYYEKSYPIGTKPGTATDLGKFTIGGSSDGGSSVAFYIRCRVPKRVTPTFTFYTGAGTSGSIAYARSGASGSVTTTGGGGTSTNGTNAGTASVGATWVPVQVEGHWTADAELQ